MLKVMGGEAKSGGWWSLKWWVVKLKAIGGEAKSDGW